MAFDNVLSVRNLRVHFPTPEGVVKALNDVNLSLDQGEILGLVGEAGSGKSLTLSAVINLVRKPGQIVDGEILFLGKPVLGMTDREMREIRGKEISVIVPSTRGELNPLLTVGDQIANVIRAHSPVSKNEAYERVAELMEMVQIQDHRRRMSAYPHELSGGMSQRILIAMALAHSPKLLLADEPTAGLDVTVQVQVLDLMRRLIKKTDSATLLVSRDLGIIAHYCTRVAVMHAGQIVECADVRPFFRDTRHPYSLALLSAVYAAHGKQARLSMTGVAPNMIHPPSGCFLHTRCEEATERCREEEPSLQEVAANHLVKCHLWEA